jgi:hypothetical protein
VNQSPLQNTCEATDGLTLFRVTSCVDSVHQNQCTNDEFFTASQSSASGRQVLETWLVLLGLAAVVAWGRLARTRTAALGVE